jgi:hypothetical protein
LFGWLTELDHLHESNSDDPFGVAKWGKSSSGGGSKKSRTSTKKGRQSSAANAFCGTFDVFSSFSSSKDSSELQLQQQHARDRMTSPGSQTSNSSSQSFFSDHSNSNSNSFSNSFSKFDQNDNTIDPNDLSLNISI